MPRCDPGRLRLGRRRCCRRRRGFSVSPRLGFCRGPGFLSGLSFGLLTRQLFLPLGLGPPFEIGLAFRFGLAFCFGRPIGLRLKGSLPIGLRLPFRLLPRGLGLFEADRLVIRVTRPGSPSSTACGASGSTTGSSTFWPTHSRNCP